MQDKANILAKDDIDLTNELENDAGFVEWLTAVGATFRGSSHSHSRVSHTARVHLFRVFVCKENRNATIMLKFQRL